MMLFLHLFNTPERAAECYNLLYIGDKPLSLLLSRIGGMCVPIFLFLVMDLLLHGRSNPIISYIL